MDKEEKPTSTTKPNEPPGHDVFCTPENSDFLSKVHYKDLSASDREIRLLKVLPTSASGFIECELLPSVKLADVHKQYLALSYCAGDALTVRHYWETHTGHQDLFLWVDQICINQANLAERSHQVGFMRAIYESANQTLICLSVVETRGDGMRWLVELEGILGNRLVFRDTTPTEDWPYTQPLVSPYEFVTEIEERMHQPEFADNWIKFCEVLNSPWWGRAWVFQEFMVSSRATFLYGPHSMDYSNMLRMISDLCLATLEILFEPNRTPGTPVKKKLKQSRITRAQISHSISKVLSVFLAKKEWYENFDLKKLLVYTQNKQLRQSSGGNDKAHHIIRE
ncbi:heterokaryon incompatibility 6 OR allele [Fusarium pseudoanthophilum]|uniref:Heterokaryon incompatibility 6 OR allele n=1 Tax=Fusarium pseudoanthophilum TaxID=48495 RepID=A0A8H5L682_9HYPO|nr:heterokaryon incompatibility 6 OR allele [Fusarium pseudoanthophilum]